MTPKPNILFINTDQQTWDAISAYGNEHVRTPNIDRLHENGVSFMRSYCTDPVCAPARASWVSGMYTSENGVPFNGGSMHPDIPDLGQILSRNGYVAARSGKWHVDGREVRDSFRNLYIGKRQIGACGGEYYDRASTHAAIDFIDRYDDPKPFFLELGLVNPHDICEYGHNHEHKTIPDPVEQGLLSPDDLPPLPENFDYDERETLLQQVMRRGDDTLMLAAIGKGIRDWTPLQWRFLTWNLYRFVEAADQQIGLLLNALEQSRFRDDTLIIFSVDHGESHGRHRMFQKFTLYDESIRTPFIVSSLGGRFGLPDGAFDNEHLVSGVDLLPTVLDYAGIGAPDGVQGASLRPLAEGLDVAWRDFVYLESNYWGRAIVTPRFKYITEYRPKDEEDFVPPGPDPGAIGIEQLFDLERDPWETRNLAGDPAQADAPDYAAALADCRGKLFEFESRLRRRPLRDGYPRAVVTGWGGHLRAAWAEHDA